MQREISGHAPLARYPDGCPQSGRESFRPLDHGGRIGLRPEPEMARPVQGYAVPTLWPDRLLGIGFAALSRGSGDIGGDDVGGMAVEAGAGPVVAHGGLDAVFRLPETGRGML